MIYRAVVRSVGRTCIGQYSAGKRHEWDWIRDSSICPIPGRTATVLVNSCRTYFFTIKFV